MKKNEEKTPIIKKFIIKSSEPKMPNIELFLNATIVPPKGAKKKLKPKKEIIRVQQQSNAIFVKSEIAKEAFQNIKDSCSSSMRMTESGDFSVKSALLIPIIKEVNSLIFELGSMLEFVSTQVDIILGLGYGSESSLYKVTERMKKDHASDSLTVLLQTFYDSDVQKYFRKMRNRITHRLPFEIRIYNVNVLFPDDPTSDALYPAIDQNIDVISTCEVWVNEILSFLDNVTGNLLKKIEMTIVP